MGRVNASVKRNVYRRGHLTMIAGHGLTLRFRSVYMRGSHWGIMVSLIDREGFTVAQDRMASMTKTEVHRFAELARGQGHEAR